MKGMGKGKEILLGDINARHTSWDATSNARERALVRSTKWSRLKIIAPQSPTYHPRGRVGYSTPDLVISNVSGIKLQVVGGGAWNGTSDHTLVLCVCPEIGGGRKNGGKRVSKTALSNEGRIEEVGEAYKQIATHLIRRLKETTEEATQEIFEIYIFRGW